MKKVLCIGSINIDMVIQSAKPPVMGETIYGDGFSVNFGGKGANQAVALAKLGCDVSFIGGVGTDVYGGAAIENLQSFGVKTDGIEKVEGPTGVAVIVVSEGDNTIILDRGANCRVTPAVIDTYRHLIEACDILVMQFEIPLESVAYAAEMAHQLGKIVLLNPAPMMEFNKNILKHTDIFVPNQHEAGMLLGMEIKTVEDGKIACKKLKELGVPRGIITLGKLGCVYYEGATIKFREAYSGITAVDSTAAGDSFVGAFCRQLSEDANMDTAISFATATGAITVSRPGASVSIPTEDEVLAFLEEQGETSCS